MKKIFSMTSIMVALLIFGTAMAIATFFESNYVTLFGQSAGEKISHQAIYNAIWFGAVQVFIVIGLIYQFIARKVYKRKSFFMILYHSSIIVILIGSIITRYFGYEGVMHIREGESSSKILSNDKYITVVKNGNDGSSEVIAQKKVSNSILKSDSFNFDFNIDGKSLTVKSIKFIPIFKEDIVPYSNGIAMAKLVLTTKNGSIERVLKDKDTLNIDDFSISLNAGSNGVKIYTKNGDFYIKSDKDLKILNLTEQKSSIVKANDSVKLQKKRLYSYRNFSFVFTRFLDKAKVKYSSKDIYNKSVLKSENISAYIANVKYKNITKEIVIKGKGSSGIDAISSISFDDFKLLFNFGSRIINLPFALHLNNFILDRYAGSNSPSSYKSIVSIVDFSDGSRSKNREIFMNHVLDHDGYRFFQASYDSDELGTIFTVNRDPGKYVTYFGYFLLMFGLFFSFFVNGRFKTLMNTKYTLVLIIFTFFIYKPVSASAVKIAKEVTIVGKSAKNMSQKDLVNFFSHIDSTHAKHFSELLIQDFQGRIKPIDTLARDVLNKVSRKTTLKGLNSSQLFLAMLVFPDYFRYFNFIKVDSKKINSDLNIDNSLKYTSYNSLFSSSGEFKLLGKVEDANIKPLSARENYEKSLITISERINIVYTTFTSQIFRVFPKQKSNINYWMSPFDVLNGLNAKGLSKSETKEISILSDLIKLYYNGVSRGVATNNWSYAERYLSLINRYQSTVGKSIIISNNKIKVELLYNSLNIFSWLVLLYLIVGILLVIVMFVNIFSQSFNTIKITKFFTYVVILGFIAHTVGLLMRWYISGHPPWSDSFEGLVFIAWTIVLAGIVLHKNSHLVLGTTSVLSGISLFIAHLSFINPQITNLVPVLKSYWLMVHVSIITASYGFLSLSALLGLFSLIFFLFASVRGGKYSNKLVLSIKETDRINQMSMIIGLALLSSGNFLGGVWANESWGRYWSWDPKETWALISIVVYIVVVHLKYIPALSSRYTFALSSLLAFFSILMTYFGVNYYLSGMHSYAKGNGSSIPSFIYVIIVLIMLLIILSYKNKSVDKEK